MSRPLLDFHDVAGVIVRRDAPFFFPLAAIALLNRSDCECTKEEDRKNRRDAASIARANILL